MADRYATHQYVCKCGGPSFKAYVWDSELRKQKFNCPHCNEVLSYNNIKLDNHSSLIAIRTPTKNR